jgi:cation diffusion facilitator CzcD-associated flavoprotein CzcO
MPGQHPEQTLVPMSHTGTPRVAVAIVGAGFSGLGMAIQLKRAGIDDFVVFEKSSALGGTWSENTYPGSACDTMSLLYSYSFAPKRDWSRMFPRQAEILDYLGQCADRYDVRRHIRFGTTVTGAQYDDESAEWRIYTAEGEAVRAKVAVFALGLLHVPHYPAIPGRQAFRGAMFHSSQWDHTYDLAGKRVAVVGTGGSAIQFVPEIADRAAHVTVFQRTPPWILPKPDRRLTRVEKWLFRVLPVTLRAYRAAIYWAHEVLGVILRTGPLLGLLEKYALSYLRRQVPDRELRRKLTPDYRLGCKRPLVSNDYYRTLTRPDVDLVTTGVERITEDAVVTADGTEHRVDTIIFGTGFHACDVFQQANADIVGKEGVKLLNVWRDGMEAYLGLAAAGFPNLFFVLGPNSVGDNSTVFMVEAQVRYILACVRLLLSDPRTKAVAVRPQVQADFNAKLQRRLRKEVWSVGGCTSWYLDADGVNRTLWPGSSVRFWLRTRRPRARDFEQIRSE